MPKRTRPGTDGGTSDIGRPHVRQERQKVSRSYHAMENPSQSWTLVRFTASSGPGLVGPRPCCVESMRAGGPETECLRAPRSPALRAESREQLLQAASRHRPLVPESAERKNLRRQLVSAKAPATADYSASDFRRRKWVEWSMD